MANNSQFAQHFRLVHEKVFNNWPGLKAAVEHGMGGRNGHQTAIEIMNYVFEYCTKNENITQGELQGVIEDLMDEEFDTICDDGSIPEICAHLLRYLRLCKEEKFAEIEAELNRLPQKPDWLRTDCKINYIPVKEDDDSSSSDADDGTSSDEMDVDMEDESESGAGSSNRRRNKKEDNFVEPEEGWTTVRRK